MTEDVVFLDERRGELLKSLEGRILAKVLTARSKLDVGAISNLVSGRDLDILGSKMMPILRSTFDLASKAHRPTNSLQAADDVPYDGKLRTLDSAIRGAAIETIAVQLLKYIVWQHSDRAAIAAMPQCSSPDQERDDKSNPAAARIIPTAPTASTASTAGAKRAKTRRQEWRAAVGGILHAELEHMEGALGTSAFLSSTAMIRLWLRAARESGVDEREAHQLVGVLKLVRNFTAGATGSTRPSHRDVHLLIHEAFICDEHVHSLWSRSKQPAGPPSIVDEPDTVDRAHHETILANLRYTLDRSRPSVRPAPPTQSISQLTATGDPPPNRERKVNVKADEHCVREELERILIGSGDALVPTAPTSKRLFELLSRHAVSTGFSPDELALLLEWRRGTQLAERTQAAVSAAGPTIESDRCAQTLFKMLAASEVRCREAGRGGLQVTLRPSPSSSTAEAGEIATDQEDWRWIRLLKALMRPPIRPPRGEHRERGPPLYAPLIPPVQGRRSWVITLRQWSIWTRHPLLFHALCLWFGTPKHRPTQIRGYSAEMEFGGFTQYEWPEVALSLLGLDHGYDHDRSRSCGTRRRPRGPMGLSDSGPQQAAVASVLYSMAHCWSGHQCFLGRCAEDGIRSGKNIKGGPCACVHCRTFDAGWQRAYRSFHDLLCDPLQPDLVHMVWHYVLYDPRNPSVYAPHKEDAAPSVATVSATR